MENHLHKLTEKQKAVLDNLLSMNDEQVISLIQDFRENGDLYIIQPLIEMLYSNRGQVLKNSILEFISDIKNQVAVSYIIQSIQKHIKDKNTTELIAACWQSNLDFSNDLPVFIEILCNGDFQSSFEAFTVIENSVGNLSPEDIDLHISTIKSKSIGQIAVKQSLIQEMIVIMKDFKQNKPKE